MNQPDDYTCHTPLPALVAAVTFRGPFLGREVTWEMQFGTLAYFRNAASQPALYRCPFIEILASATDVYPIRVGLLLQEIDAPAISKAIIMIRNYKRLAVGVHEFCREEDG